MAIKRSRLIFKPLVFIASLIPLGWLVFALWSDTAMGTLYLTSDPVQELNREVGDWALIFIILTLAVRPAGEILKKGEFVAYRRMIGLFAFFYAILHLTSYVAIDLQFNLATFIEDVIKRNYITIGILAILMLIPLAITSTKGMVKRLGGRKWRKLHLLVYPIAILGVIHFYMMIRADFTRPIIYGSVIFLLLAYRVWKARQRSCPRKAAETAV